MRQPVRVRHYRLSSEREGNADDREADEARRREWTGPPTGRLGRLLLAGIEPYLGFFAIAGAD
jgi:hypothetical protein